MIISHKHKFIFIRTKKIASTAIQEVFRPFLGPKDIFTTWRKNDPRCKEYGGLQSHTPYIFMQKHFPHLLKEYFLFTGVRHPMDQIISNYFQNIRKDKGKTFSYYIRNEKLDMNYKIITDKEGSLPETYDYIFKYESVQEDINRIAAKLGLEGMKPLPRRKAHHRADYRPWKEFISKNDQEYISKKISDHLWLYRKLGYDI